MLYFAYGSNMLNRRLQLRVPSAKALFPASLAGYQLRFHKKSNTDGSGKCSLVEKSSSTAYGVVFEIIPDEKTLLDKAEGLGNGYKDLHITLTPEFFGLYEENLPEKHGPVTAFTYLATESHIDESLLPFQWYKQLVVEGAVQHYLPESYIEEIRQTQALPDPDRQRREKARNILSSSVRS